MGLTKVSGDVIQGTINVGVVTATTINVGSAVTIHTGGFRVGSSDLHSSGLTVQNLNSTGVVTATSFIGNITGNVTGNATGLSGTPNITVGSITASSATITGNVSVAGTVTYDDVTNVDSLGVGTFRSGIVVNTGTATTALVVNGSSRITGILSVGQGTITINGNTDKITTPKLDYAGISSTITATATDVFVYDTRKDSDGGAWRKRTQHTSWYNETLNTATRGSRRDFPAVAVIVCAATSVTIYDGDDPDMPMWMVFNTVNGMIYTSANNLTSVSMLNGTLVWTGFRSGIINFISESAELLEAGYAYTLRYGIVNRNVSATWNLTTGRQIVNNTCNDVAMTVLPNAPIDSATGLPVPTIAVATSGGTSIIRDDGTVVDIYYSNFNVANSVHFTKDNKIAILTDSGTGGARFYRIYEIPSSGLNGGAYNNMGVALRAYNGDIVAYNYPIRFNVNISSDFLTNNFYANALVYAKDGPVFGRNGRGIALIAEATNPVTGTVNGNLSASDGMVCGISTSTNTGWMHGDIKGAFLSDTDTTSVTGTELVTNGTFTSNTTGWSISDGSGTVTISSVSGQLNIVMNNNLNGYRWAYQTINSLPSGSYAISADVVSNPSNRARIRVGTTGANTTDLVDSGYLTGTGTFSVYFTTTSTQNVTLTLMSDLQTGTGIWDNIVFRKVEADRSVNNKGLQVFGTITKTAVATGADLVAYSGFSTSNYLHQPYNSALDFGTGDFCVMGWIKTTDSSTNVIMSKSPPSSITSPYFEFQMGGGSVTWVHTSGGGALSFGSINTGTWRHLVYVRSSGTGYGYKDGVLIGSHSNTGNYNHSNTDTLRFGYRQDGYSGAFLTGSLALWRVSATAPSPDQITKIYNDEKALFQENSKATLYGTSSAVTALAYDDSTRLLYAGTSSGRSDFQGLERINNTTTAVTTAISASNGLVAEQ